ncbi:MAG: rhodanese-related sulfurtransferase [Cyclobacteriaceae bacterium]|jgi:rhodanese-related sulfurtransferase
MFSFLKKKYQTIDIAAFKELRRTQDIIILDVRSRGEQVGGLINGQRNLNLKSPDFKEKISKMDKSKTYVAYCRSGARSAKACKIMTENGFISVYNLKGGFIAWETENN